MVEYAGRLVSDEDRRIIEMIESHSPGYRALSKKEQERYNEFVNGFNSERARETLDRTSNLFKIVGLNQIGIRTATLPELELILENAPEFLEGHYEDAQEVILRSAGDSYKPNDKMAKDLAKVIGNPDFKVPHILKGLKVEEDSNSDYGLTLVPGENFQYFEAPDFSHENNNRKFKRINPDYSIDWSKDGEKGRTFYSRRDGLSRLDLGGGLGLFSGWGSLVGSVSCGRVVVIDAEGGARENLDKYLTNLQQERDK